MASHSKEVQALTNAIMNTLKWNSRPFGGGHHGEDAARTDRQGQGALSGRAQEYDPDVFGNRRHGPQGVAAAVLAVFSESSPEVAKANIDVGKTYTNKYVEEAGKMGMNAK